MLCEDKESVRHPAVDRVSDNGYAADARALIAGGDARSGRCPSARNVAICVGVIDAHAFTRECIVRSLRALDDHIAIMPFAGCAEYLQNNGSYDIILYHLHPSTSGQRHDTEERLLQEILQRALVIILSPTEEPECVSSALRDGARGYIPTTSTTFDLTIEIIRLVRAGGIFVPPSSLSPRSSDPPCATAGAVAGRRFTRRETAVLEHLKRGQPNKIIAHELELSESTVKVHIRNIMKKMNVTNRTEAACHAHSIADAVHTGAPNVSVKCFP